MVDRLKPPCGRSQDLFVEPRLLGQYECRALSGLGFRVYYHYLGFGMVILVLDL